MPRPFRDGTEQATTLEEVAEFCYKRYHEKRPDKFPSTKYVLLGERSAYMAVYLFITGRVPDTPEDKAP